MPRLLIVADRKSEHASAAHVMTQAAPNVDSRLWTLLWSEANHKAHTSLIQETSASLRSC